MEGIKNVADIGRTLKFYRKNKNLTQAQLSKMCQLSAVSISNMENGVGGTLGTLVKMMQALEVEISMTLVKKLNKKSMLDFLD
jgi:transcriptional regulator with XRE-family HTH domain